MYKIKLFEIIQEEMEYSNITHDFFYLLSEERRVKNTRQHNVSSITYSMPPQLRIS